MVVVIAHTFLNYFSSGEGSYLSLLREDITESVFQYQCQSLIFCGRVSLIAKLAHMNP